MSKEYSISKTSGVCNSCGNVAGPGQELMATVREAGEELQRQDFCMPCWQAAPRDQDKAILAIWHTQVPLPQEKKKLFVDDELIISFFERLHDSDEDALKVSFRFVLALVLMRKKLLVYDGMEKLADGRDVWKMHFKGKDRHEKVIDPHLDEQKIAQVSESLGQVLEGEL